MGLDKSPEANSPTINPDDLAPEFHAVWDWLDPEGYGALQNLIEQLGEAQNKLTPLYAGYSAKCERWTLGTCDNVYDGKPLCRICAFFTNLGWESFEVTTGGLRSWRPVKELDESVLT